MPPTVPPSPGYIPPQGQKAAAGKESGHGYQAGVQDWAVHAACAGVESQVGGCDLLTQSLGGCPRRCLWGSDFVYVSPGPRSNGGGGLSC